VCDGNAVALAPSPICRAKLERLPVASDPCSRSSVASSTIGTLKPTVTSPFRQFESAILEPRMTDEDFLELLSPGERPGVEFKNARARGDRSFVEVAKAVLGMANRRDGGIVIIGVEDNGSAVGLDPVQRASWEQADHVRQALAPYADPFVYVDIEVKTIPAVGALTGRSFAIIRVAQFEEHPVICAKLGKDANGKDVTLPGSCATVPIQRSSGQF
jgi:hypothetical protein